MSEPTREQIEAFMRKVNERAMNASNFMFMSIQPDGQIDVVTPMDVLEALSFLMEVFDKLNTQKFNRHSASE